MAFRTPSKIIGVLSSPPYFVRFVTHGAAIKYSSIIKNLNRKPLGINTKGKPITFIGFAGYKSLINYPNINKGSDFQLINSLPPSLVNQMIAQGEIILGENVIMEDGVVLTMFAYELEM